MTVFPLSRFVELNAATASSRGATVAMFVRNRPSRVSIDALDLVPSGAGLHVAAMFRDGRDGDAVAARAQEQGVGASSIRRYYAGRPREGLALGFGLIAANRVDEGVARLTSALARTPARTRARRR